MNKIEYIIIAPLNTLGQKAYYEERKKMLEELGYKVELISFNVPKQLFPKLGPFYSIKTAWIYRKRLSEYLITHKPKIIEFQVAVSILQKNKIFKKYQTIISFDHPYCLQVPWYASFLSHLETKKFKKTTKIITRSNYALNLLKKEYKNIAFIPHSIQKIIFEKKNHLKKDYVLAYCYGGENKDFNLKGLDLLINTWNFLHKKKGETLKIVGVSKLECLNYLNRLNLNVSSDIEFLGKLNKEEFFSLISGSKFIINASRSEAFGRTTLESLALKKLVFSTPTLGSIEILGDIDKNLISNSFSPESLSNVIINYNKNYKNLEKKIKKKLLDYRYDLCRNRLQEVLKGLI